MSATEAGNLGTSGVSAEAGSFDTSGVSAETGIFDTSGVSAETGIFDAGGVSAEGGIFETSGLNAESGIFETRGLNARDESYTIGITQMCKSTGGESYTRGITHRLPKLIPVVSPQPISFSFSGRTLSGLNSHCGVRSAFSFSRSRFLFPCGGVV